YNVSETSDNLMSYSNGFELVKDQWDDIHNPALIIGLLESDEDGEHNSSAHLALTSSGHIIDEFYQNDKKIGVTILIAKNFVVEKIKYKGVQYNWDASSQAFINSEFTDITTKKINKPSEKVNLFRSRGD